MKIKVVKGFRHDGHYVEPDTIIDVPTPDARALVARGKAEDYKEAKPKKTKREYQRRDMVAEKTPEPVQEQEKDPELALEEPPQKTHRRWNYSFKADDE